MLRELNCPNCLERMNKIHAQQIALVALINWRCLNCNSAVEKKVTPIDAEINERATVLS